MDRIKGDTKEVDEIRGPAEFSNFRTIRRRALRTFHQFKSRIKNIEKRLHIETSVCVSILTSSSLAPPGSRALLSRGATPSRLHHGVVKLKGKYDSREGGFYTFCSFTLVRMPIITSPTRIHNSEMNAPHFSSKAYPSGPIRRPRLFVE